MSEQLIATPGTFGENGNFLLERELGAGGMGGVYMGRDKMLDRPVAVKVMLKEYGSDPEFVEKFKKEAQAAARLIHPNIAQIYSYGICDGMPYIAMELASGGSLYSIMNANPGKTDIQRVLKICQQVAQALQCSSDQGVVHGDVKPENILLDANGNAKLVDFGLAAMQKDTAEIWGTPYYISPEKVKKETVDFRADMYSLGGTLYHALTGVAPFEGDDSVAVVKKRFEGMPAKPSSLRPEITPAIDELVMTMLALDKEKRYPSFEALIQAFKDVLTSGLSTTSAPPLARPAAGGGTRRMAMRTRRGAMIRKPGGTTIKKHLPGDEEGEDPATSASGKEDDEDENGGNLGLKVALFIIGGILLIGGVVGGLFWYQYAEKKARETERIQTISSNISKARAVVLDIRKATEKFEEEFAEFATRATKKAEDLTKELSRLLPDWKDSLKPAPTKELLDAIASTNTAAAVAAPPPAQATTNAAPAAVAATNAPAASAGSATTNAAPETAEAEPPKQAPSAVTDMQEIWEKAYFCQACQIRVSAAIAKIYAECAKADEIKGETEENMKTLGNLSIAIKDLYDQVVASKDVVDVKKTLSLIDSKGKKVLEMTVKRLRIEKIESERKAKKEAQAAAEKAAKEKAEEERKALVEEEVSAISAKFDAVAAQGCFRQLDWRSALRQLESTAEGFKTAEGQLAAKLQLHKVNAMKKVQDIFIAKMKGHVFRGKPKKGQMNGLKVSSINDKEIQAVDAKGHATKMTWAKFYKDCPGNLNDAINTFIVKGRRNSGLGLKDWADAMSGAALTMKLVCSEVNGATEYAEQLVKQTIEAFPEYAKTAKEMFPDIEIEAATEE